MHDATTKQPTDIDRLVGARVRMARKELKLSQEKLGLQVGLTFQQIQKYERGTNRISAGILYEFSKILEKPITYFYDEKVEPSMLEREIAIAYEDCLSIIEGLKGTDKIVTAREMLFLVKS